MVEAQAHLESLWGQPLDEPAHAIRGILQTSDYQHFQILSDTGDLLLTFEGAQKANRCLPGDHVGWEEKCVLELRDEHPPLVCTLELTNNTTYGMTKRGHPMYLCTPYDRRYPPFVAGSSERDRTQNRIVLVELEKEIWTKGTFPRALIQRTLGVTGSDAEREALIWQASPWRYPDIEFTPTLRKEPAGCRRELKGYTFHVDPVGCRDVDDVFTVSPLEDGWQITITIADVAAYVEEGCAVDIMASLIGQTLYDAEGRVLRPMLPAAYSEGACSLLPGGVSYGLSLSFVFHAGITAIEWFQSTLYVDQSFTYEEFQTTTEPVREVIREVAECMQRRRGQAEVMDAHGWVAELMIFYNTEAGKRLAAAGQGILRRHRAPDRARLDAYRAIEGVDLTALAYAAAEYCLPEEADTQHYGLGTATYAHASSPIRRYADLVNQRTLIGLLQGAERAIVPQAMYDMNLRAKAVKRFARDMDLLTAIRSGEREFEAIIMEVAVKDAVNGAVKIRLYVPAWRRMITARYRMQEGRVLSRDETAEIDVTLYRRTRIRCVWQPQARNWKERAIIEVQ